MIKFSKWMAPAILLVACISGPATAQVTYDYTGNNFTTTVGAYTTTDFLSGQLTLGSALADNFNGFVTPTAFSFSDGIQTLTNSTPLAQAGFLLITDATGAITQWQWLVKAVSGAEMLSIGLGASGVDGTVLADGVSHATSGSPGVWSPATTLNAAPEIDPSSAASGLVVLVGGLLVFRGRRQQPLAA